MEMEEIFVMEKLEQVCEAGRRLGAGEGQNY